MITHRPAVFMLLCGKNCAALYVLDIQQLTSSLCFCSTSPTFASCRAPTTIYALQIELERCRKTHFHHCAV